MAQGSVYKSVFKNAAYIFFIKLFPAIALFAVTIVYSRALPREDYGDYQGVWVKLLLLGTLAYAGMPVTIITYAANVIKELARTVLKKYLWAYLGWLVVWMAVIAYLLKAELSLAWVLSAGLLGMYVVHAVQEALLMAAKHMRGVMVTNLLYAIYFLAIHVTALEDYNLERLLYYLLAGMVVRAVVLGALVYLIYKKVEPMAVPEGQASKAKNLWLHLGFYDLLQNVFRFGDKFILSVLLTSGLYAVYYNGAQEIPFLPYLLGAVSSSVLVQLAGKRDGGEVAPYRLMYASGKLLSCIVFPLFFFLFFYSEEIFVVVFTEKYLPSVPIFMMTLLVLPLRAYNYTTLLQHMHRGGLINKGAIMDLVLALALMYPMYQLMGLPGIALGFVVSTYLQVAYYLHHTARLSGTRWTSLLPLKNWGLKLLVFGLGIYLLHSLTRGMENMTLAVVAGGVGTAVAGMVALYLEVRGRRQV